jgi:hypothetical protein|tara:strand:+ start:322 stop:783 length:462 start_codon:yes stop_codon:yes gene_type:complete
MSQERYQELDRSEIHVVPLSLAELLFLNDSSTALVAASDYEGSMPLRQRLSTSVIAIAFPMLDKIMVGIHFLLSEVDNPSYETEVEIELFSSELYLIREASISQARYGKYPVGLTLLKKVCGILFGVGVPPIDLEALRALETLLSDVEGLDDE